MKTLAVILLAGNLFWILNLVFALSGSPFNLVIAALNFVAVWMLYTSLTEEV